MKGYYGLRSVRLPAAPLQQLIRYRALEHGGLRGLGRIITTRFGKEVKYGERELQKVLASPTVGFVSADRICTALNVHPAMLWGWTVYLNAGRKEAMA